MMGSKGTNGTARSEQPKSTASTKSQFPSTPPSVSMNARKTSGRVSRKRMLPNTLNAGKRFLTGQGKLYFRLISCDLYATKLVPRLWMVDYFGPATSAPTEAPVAIHGLEVRHIATLSLTLMQALFLRGTYTARPMPRMVEFIWEAGRKAHFLVTPNGSQFIMQSISQKHLAQMTVDNVQEMLTNALKEVPKGWKFETRVLESDVVVKTDAGVGHVLGLQDEFDNTYMYVGDAASFAGVR
ncbi:hypothetical protein HDU81_008430 [Chytriomyces hyalinus]|nr:hypothetical protein HDU81_008430 [Chytriomyces hyalinus]